jgi:hypothetical protein
MGLIRGPFKTILRCRAENLGVQAGIQEEENGDSRVLQMKIPRFNLMNLPRRIAVGVGAVVETEVEVEEGVVAAVVGMEAEAGGISLTNEFLTICWSLWVFAVHSGGRFICSPFKTTIKRGNYMTELEVP